MEITVPDLVILVETLRLRDDKGLATVPDFLFVQPDLQSAKLLVFLLPVSEYTNHLHCGETTGRGEHKELVPHIGLKKKILL